MNRRGFFGTFVAAFAARLLPKTPEPSINFYEHPEVLIDPKAMGPTQIVAPYDGTIYFMNHDGAWKIAPGKYPQKISYAL